MRRATPYWLSGLLALLFVQGLILIQQHGRSWRWDFTAQQRHVLSGGAKELLATLEQPVRLRLFFSDNALAAYGDLHRHGQTAQDLLNAIDRAGGDKIRVEQIAPELFSAEEDLALSAGLVPLPLPQGGQAWLGLEAVNDTGGHGVMAQLLPERADYLEYDIMQLVAQLGAIEKPRLGVITNLPLDTGAGGLPAALAGESEAFLIYRELAERFSLHFLERDLSDIPSSLDALLVAHPRALAEPAQRALDDYLMGGGRLALFLDPHSEISLLAADGAPVKGYSLRSDMPALLQAWGIAYAPDQLLLDRTLAQAIVLRDDAGQTQVPYFLWPSFQGNHINQTHPITSGLEWVNAASVGVIAPIGEVAKRFTPLLTSSSDSALVEYAAIAANPHPSQLTAGFSPDDASHWVGGLVSGPFTSAFASRAQSPPSALLAVIADSDIFDDRFWADRQRFGTGQVITPFADNGALILNLLDYLAGAPQFLALRARNRQPAHFTYVQALERQARAHWQEDIAALETAIAAHQAGQGGDEEELLQARRQLREIRLLLRRDVADLFFALRLINLAALPVLLLMLALFIWLWRRAT